MTTESADILARKEKYGRIERSTDRLGRVIGVKRLKPSQQLKIEEFAPGLAGTVQVSVEIEKGTSQTIDVPRNSPLAIAGSVVEIDGAAIPFPKNRGELDAILDRLDEEGIEAAGIALACLADTSETLNAKETAKN